MHTMLQTNNVTRYWENSQIILSFDDISKAAPGEPSASIRERVIAARRIQEVRFKDFKGIHCNAQMTERMIHQFASALQGLQGHPL